MLRAVRLGPRQDRRYPREAVQALYLSRQPVAVPWRVTSEPRWRMAAVSTLIAVVIIVLGWTGAALAGNSTPQTFRLLPTSCLGWMNGPAAVTSDVNNPTDPASYRPSLTASISSNGLRVSDQQPTGSAALDQIDPTLTCSGFHGDRLADTLFAKASASFNLAVTGSTDSLGVFWLESSIDGKIWTKLKTFRIGDRIVGSQRVDLTDLKGSQLAKLQLRLRTDLNPLEDSTVAVDGLGIDATYQQPIHITASDVTRTKRQVDALTAFSQQAYRSTEQPVLTVPKKKTIRALGLFKVQDITWTIQSLTARDSLGHESELKYSTTDILAGQDVNSSVRLDTHNLHPGKYSLKLRSVSSEGVETEVTKQFLWGVTALNVTHAIARPGDEQMIGMAVLDDGGRTLCDATIDLTVTDPRGQVTSYSTQEQSIHKSSQCVDKNVTNEPDYSVTLKPTISGLYALRMSATTKSGKRVDQESFQVDDSVPFDVGRVNFPTRLYPIAAYPIRIAVTAKNDFSGSVREILPRDFVITKPFPDARLAPVIEDSTKQYLEWNVDWKKGETYFLGYTFDAPDISPALFTLGPLQIGGNSFQGAQWQEPREWQLASDAILTVGDADFTADQTDVIEPLKASYRRDETVDVKIYKSGYRFKGDKVKNGVGKNRPAAVTKISLVRLATGEVENFTTTTNDIVRNGRGLELFHLAPPSRDFHPGQYILQLTLSDGATTSVESRPFAWGVLAVNLRRSIERPNTATQIGLAVLNKYGHTECAVPITLVVTDPDGQSKTLTTKDGSIVRSDTCANGNITNDFDFAAPYTTGGVGTYSLHVSSNTGEGDFSIDDTFEVQNQVDFDVQRTKFSMRIYPYGDPYDQQFTIVANKDYQGPVTERVPLSFDITAISDNGNVVVSADHQDVTWTVDWKAGETHTLGYTVDFPDVSPEFYQLGPLTIGDFQEARQWQIASDATCTIASGTGLNWSTAGWSGCTGGGYPGQNASGDSVQINTGVTITLNVSPANTVANVTIGTSTFNTITTLTFGAGNTLHATGTTTIGATNETANYTIDVAGGTYTADGAITINGGSSSSRLGKLNVGNGAQAAGTITAGGGVTCAGTAADAQIAMTAPSSGTNLFNVTSGAFGSGGAVECTLNASASGNVKMSGSATQTMVNSANYPAVEIATTSSATAQNATTAAAFTFASLTIDSGGKFTKVGATSANMTVTGTSSITGTFTTATAATGTLTFTGAVTVSDPGVLDLSGQNPTVTFTNATLTNNSNTAGSFKTGTGTLTLAASPTFAGSGTGGINLQQATVTIASGSVFTNSITNGTLTFSGSTGLTFSNPTVANTLSLTTGSTTSVTNTMLFTANSSGTVKTMVQMNGNANITVGTLTLQAPSGAGNTNVSEQVTCNAGSGTFTATTVNVTGNSTSTGDAELDMQGCTFTANGLVTLTGGTNATGVALLKGSNGTMNINAGLSEVAGGTITNAKLTTSSTETINFVGTWTGAGTLSLNSGTLTKFTGASTALNAAFGTSTWAKWEVVSGTTTLGATQTITGLQVDAGATLAGATFLLTDKCSGADTSGFRIDGTFSGTSGGAALDTASCVIDGRTSGGGAASIAFTTGTVTVSATMSIGSNANLSVSSTTSFAISGAVTLTNNGTVTTTGTSGITGSVAGSTWTQGTNAVLHFGGNTTTLMSGATLDANTNSGNTVDYSQNGAQTCKVTNYQTLKFSGGGTKTCTITAGTNTIQDLKMTAGSWSPGQNVTVANTLTVEGGTLTTGNFNLTITGTTSITSGTLQLDGTGTKTLQGLVTLNGTGNLTGASAGIVLGSGATAGGITNTSGTVTITGTVTMSTNNGALVSTTAMSITTLTANTASAFTHSGAGGLTVSGTLTVTSPAVLTNTGLVTSTGTLAGTGNFTNGNGGTLHLAATPTITTLSASTNANTVDFNGDAGITIPLVTYWNLTMTPTFNATDRTYTMGTGTTTISNNFTINPTDSTGSGNTLTVTMAGAINVTGLTTIDGSGTVNGVGKLDAVGSNNLTTGTLDIESFGTFLAQTSTVTLNTSTASSTLFTLASSNATFTAGTSTLKMSSDAAETLTSGTFTSGNAFSTLQLVPAITANRTYTFGTGAIAATTFTIQPTNTANTLTVNMAGNITTTGLTTIDGTTATGKLDTVADTNSLTSGTLTVGAKGNLTMTGTAPVLTLNTSTGSSTLFTLTSGGVFSAGTSTVTIQSDGATENLTGGTGSFTSSNAFNTLTLSPTMTSGRAYSFGSNAVTINSGFNVTPAAGSALALTVNLGSGGLTVSGTTTIAPTSSATANLTTTASNYALTTNALTISNAGTFTGNATTTVTVTTDVTINAGGTLSSTSGNLSVGGNFTVNSTGAYTHNSGLLTMTNTVAKSMNGTSTTTLSLYKLTVNVSGTSAVTLNGSYDVTVNNALNVGDSDSLTIATGRTMTAANTITMNTSGTIASSGTGLFVIKDTSTSGPVGGTLSASVRFDASAANIPSTIFIARTYGGAVELYNSSGAHSITAAAGAYTFSSTLTTTESGGTSLSATLSAATGSPAVAVTGTVTIGVNTTLTAPASAIMTAGGAWSNSGTFTSNSGTVKFIGTSSYTVDVGGGSNTFNNVIFDGIGGAWRPNANNFRIDGDFTLTNGTIQGNGGNWIIVKGNIACGATCGSIDMTLNSGTGVFEHLLTSGSKNFGTSVSGDTTNWKFYDLMFDGNATATTSTTPTSPGTITITHQMTIAIAGTTLDAGNRTWILSGTGTGASAPLINAGTLTGNASTFKYTGADATTDIKGTTYYNLTLAPTITTATAYNANGAITATGALSINPTSSGANALTFTLGGTTSFTGLTTITRTTSATSELNTSAASHYNFTTGGLTINAGGTFTGNTSTTVTVNGDITIASSGTLTSTSGNVTTSGTFSNSGVFTHNSGTLTMTGSGKTLTSGGSTLNNVTLSGSITLANATHTIAGNLSLTGGTITAGTSLIDMTGTTKTIDGGSQTLYDLTIDGTTTLQTAAMSVSHVLTISGTKQLTINQDLTLTSNAGTPFVLSGTLAGSNSLYYQKGDTSSASFPTSGTITANIVFDTINGNGGDSFSLIPNRTASAPFGGNVTCYDNPSGVTPICKFLTGTPTISGNLLVADNGNGASLDASSNHPDITISGNVSATGTGGSLSMGSGTWTVGGNFDLTNFASFANNSGTIVLNGNSKTLTTNGQTLFNLTFSGGGTDTLSGTVTAAGNVVLNTSVAAGSLTMTGTKNLTGGTATLDNLTVSGSPVTLQTSNLTVGTLLTVSSSKSLTINSGIVLTLSKTSGTSLTMTSATINGPGKLIYQSTSTFPSDGTLASIPIVRFDLVNVAANGSMVIPQRSDYGAVEVYNNSASNKTLKTNSNTTYTLNGITANLYIYADGGGNTTFDATGAGTVNSPMTVPGNLDFLGTGAGSEIITSGTGTWTVTGTVDFSAAGGGAGTYTATSGNTFVMNGLTKTLTSNGNAFSNLTFSGSGTTTMADSISASGDVVLNGSIGGGSLTMSGVGKNLTGGSATLANLTISNSSGTITLTASNLTVNTVLTINSGANLTLGSGRTLTLSRNNVSASFSLSGTLTGTGTLIYQNFLADNGGTYFPTTGTLAASPNAPTIRFDTANGTLHVPARTDYGTIEAYKNGIANVSVVLGTAASQSLSLSGNLDIQNANATNTLTLDGNTNTPVTMTITGNVTNSVGTGNTTFTMGAGTWTVSGNFDLTNIDSFSNNSGTLALNGSSAKALTSNGQTVFNLTISGAGATTLSDAAIAAGDVILNSTVSAGSLTMNGAGKNLTGGSATLANLTISNGSGTITLTGSDLTVSTVLAISANANLTLASGRVLTLSRNNASASFTLPTNATLTGPGTLVYQNFTADNGGTYFPTTGTLASNPIIRFDTLNGNLHVPARTDYGSIEAYGDAGISAARTVTLGTASSQTITTSGYLDVIANSNTGGRNVTLNGSTNDPTLNVGGDFAFTGTGSTSEAVTAPDASATWTVTGNFDLTNGTWTAGAETLKMNGTANLKAAGQTIKNVTIDGTNSTVTVTGSDLTVSGTLTIGGDAAANTDVLSIGSGRQVLSGTAGAVTLTDATDTISGSGTLNVENSNLSDQGTLSANVTYTIVSSDINATARTYGANLTFDNTNGGGSVFLSTGTFAVTGNMSYVCSFNCDAVFLDGGDFNPFVTIGGSFSVTDPGNASSMSMGNQTWTVSGSFNLTGLGSLSATGTLLMNGTGTLTSNSLSLNNVTLDTSGGGTITLANAAQSIAGNLVLTSGGTLTDAGTSTEVDMTGTNKTITGAGKTLRNLTIAGTITLQTTDLTVSTLLTVNTSKSLTINSSRTLTLSGNSGTTLSLSGTINGPGTLTYQNSATAFPAGGALASILIARFDLVNVSSGGSMVIPQRADYGAVEAYNNSSNNKTLKTNSNSTYTLTGSTANLYIYADGTGNTTFDATGATTVNSPMTIGGNLDFRGTGSGSEAITSGTGTWTVSGSVDFSAAGGGSGTYTATSGNTLVMNGTSKTLTTNANSLDNVTFSGSTTTTLADSVTATGNVVLNNTISAGSTTMTLSGTSKTLTGGSATLNNLTVSGTITIQTSGVTVGSTLSVTGTLSGTQNVTVNGTASGSGTVTLTGGTFEQRVGAAQNFGSTSGSNDWTFNNLTFSNSSGSDRTVTFASTGSGQVIVSGTLTIGNGSDSNVTTVDNETNDRVIDANGAVAITAKGSLTASSTASFTVAGNWTLTSGGVFTAGTGTVTIDGASQQTLTGTMTGSNKFNNLTITNNSGSDPDSSPSVIFANDLATGATLTAATAGTKLRFNAGSTYTPTAINLNGQSTSTPVVLHSSNAGTTFTFSAGTGSRTVSNTFEKDSDACGSDGGKIDASDGTNHDEGNDKCWVFGKLTVSLSATSVNLGALSSSTNSFAGISSTVSTTAANGYVSFVKYGATLTFGSNTIADVSGSGADNQTAGMNPVVNGGAFGVNTSKSGQTITLADSDTSGCSTNGTAATTNNAVSSKALTTSFQQYASNSSATNNDPSTLCFISTVGVLNVPGTYTSTATLVTTAKF